MSGRQPPRSATTGGLIVWVLTVTWGGRKHRFSTVAVDLTESTTGNTLHFSGGLNDPQFSSQTLEALSVTIEGPSIPLEVVFEGYDIAAEWRAGRKIARATAELAMVIVDRRTGESRQTWEARFPLVSGPLVNPQWGLPNRPVGWAAFSIEARAYDDTTPILSPNWKICPATWSNAPEALQNKPYPMVFGDAGVYTQSDGTSGNAAITPAYRIDGGSGSSDTVLVSVMATEAALNSASVLLLEPSSGTTFVASVSTTTDTLLQTVTVADISAVSGAPTAIRQADQLYACWNNGGGILNPLNGERTLLTRGGDLLRFLFSRTGMPIDEGAWEAVVGIANRITFAGHVDDPEADTWEFCRDQLLPWLPLSVVRDVDGLIPISLLPPAPASQLPLLTVGPGLALVSPETCTRKISEIVNDLTLQFSIDRDGAPLDTQRLGAWVVQEAQAGFTHDLAQTSSAEYGTQVGTARTADFIWDRSTARRILRTLIRLEGFLPTRIVLHADPEYGWVRRGRWFALTAEDLSMTTRRAQCIARSWIGARNVWELTFQIEDDASREGIA
jgi:hypothetical protein